MKLDLSFKDPYGSLTAAEPPKKGKKKEEPDIMPSMTFYGDAAKALIKKLSAGDEFTAKVTFRVAGVSDRAENSNSPYRQGCSVDVEGISMEVEGMKEDDEGEQTADEAIDEYQKGLKE